MAEDYVCTLDEQSLKVALDELHEDPKERMSAVQALRTWVEEHPHIKCDTSAAYMLWFLRAGKFSQLLARTKLEKFLGALDEYPEWLRDIDVTDEKIIEFLKTGYIVPLGRDKLGREVNMYRVACLDPSKYKKATVMKAIFAFIFHQLGSESAQVNGISFICDCTGFEMKHLTFFGIEDMKRMQKLWQGCLPARYKGFHYYNTGAVFDTLMAALMPLLQQKFKDRITIHGSNLENVYKVFPMEMLPDEYLPDDYTGKSAGPIQQLVDKMIKDFTHPNEAARLKRETGPTFGIDKEKKFTDEPQASFRKLNVD